MNKLNCERKLSKLDYERALSELEKIYTESKDLYYKIENYYKTYTEDNRLIFESDIWEAKLQYNYQLMDIYSKYIKNIISGLPNEEELLTRYKDAKYLWEW